MINSGKTFCAPRIIALLLICAFAIGLFAVQVGAHRVTEMPLSEDFESGSIGAITGWHERRPASGDVVAIVRDGETDNKVAQLTASTAAGGHNEPYLQSAFVNGIWRSSITVEFMMKTNTAASNKRFELMLRDGTYPTGNFANFIRMINGRFQCGTGYKDVGAYRADEWYHIKAVIDTVANTFRVVITGEDGASVFDNNLPLATGSWNTLTSAALRFQTYNSADATPTYGWFDDFKVYYTPKVVAVEGPVFHNAGDAEITELSTGRIKSVVSADSFSGADRSVTSVLALFDGGILKDIGYTFKSVTPGDEEVTSELELTDMKESYSVAAFAWNKLNEMRPLSSYSLLLPPGEQVTHSLNATSLPPDATVAIEGEFKDDIVTIEGTISSGEGRRVTMLVLWPDSALEDLATGDIKDIVNNIAEQTVINSTGKFTFSFAMDNSFKGGEYTVLVGGDGVSQIQSYSYRFIDRTKKQEAMDAINNAVDGKSILDNNVFYDEEYKQAFDVIDLQYEEYELVADKQWVCERIYDKRPYQGTEGENKLRQIFLESAILAQINQAEESDLASVLLRHKDALPVDLSEGSLYDTLVRKKEISSVFQEIKDIEFDDVGVFGFEFRKTVVLTSMFTSNHGELQSIVENNYDVLGWDLSGDYSGLSDMDKAEVFKRIAGLKSKDEIDRVFPVAVKEVVDKVKEIIETPTSPSGGGRTSTVSISPALLPAANDPVTDMKEDPEEDVGDKWFKDLEEVAWARECIEFLAAKKIIEGFDDNTFRPSVNVTREQFVKMLVTALQLEEADEEADFTDVEEDAWYKPFLEIAKKAGIIHGMADGSFGAGQEIIRQDMIVMAHRAAMSAGILLPENTPEIAFADADEIEPYSRESVLTMQKAGIINGNDVGMLLPNGLTTRAESAKVIYELLKFVNENQMMEGQI